MEQDLEKLGYDWVINSVDNIDMTGVFYCQNRDIFQAKVDKMMNDLLKAKNIDEDSVYLVSAMTGEIGNNSFDHNLGKWTDIAGVFFGYETEGNNLKIVLADRGQGVLKSLRQIRPELENDAEALKVAFTEKISGRAPENRGNGLKFVRENVKNKKMHLAFISGNAQAELNEKMEIKETKENIKIKGCLAILSL
ncbi:hypothetical protein L6267_01215 [Candidatus Parcubacteria bacterium]|nr:hypothetical protein [Candidatus Parcubacteria bacterium]MCG2809561.1 hypothetical protein [Candidatus Portnoybacteria bacterium]